MHIPYVLASAGPENRFVIFIFELLCNTFCSDWNGSKRGHVYKFLRSQGFESTYDTAHEYTDNDDHKVGDSGFQFLKH